MMTTFLIDGNIFSVLRATDGINLNALQRLVDSANRITELNAALTHVDGLNNLTIRLALNDELSSLGAGAIFDYASFSQENNYRMAIILDPSWLIGPNATLAASSVATRAGVLAVFGHELDHYMRVDTFRNLDQFQNPGYRPELTGEERFELYATQRMQAEVQGWYAGLRTYRTEIAGSASANLSALDTQRLTAVERLLLNVEAQGRQLGLSGPALESFVGERGAAVLSRNSTYWDTYVDAMRAVPGINADVVRQRLAYRLDQPDDVVAWSEQVGADGRVASTIVYANGERVEEVRNADLSGEASRFDASGQLIGKEVVTVLPDGSMVFLAYGGDGVPLSSTTVQTFDDGSRIVTTLDFGTFESTTEIIPAPDFGAGAPGSDGADPSTPNEPLDPIEQFIDHADLHKPAMLGVADIGGYHTQSLESWSGQAGGLVFTSAEAHADGIAVGTDAADILYGKHGQDDFSAGGGDDSLYGADGDDALDGGTGVDWLQGDNGDDFLAGGAGDDRLIGGEGSDVLRGDEGDDFLFGGAGGDTLAGGAGNDSLAGETGSDLYLYGRGDGEDWLIEEAGTTGDTDVLAFGRGIEADHLWFREVGTTLEISIIGSGDKINIADWTGGESVESFKLAGGQCLFASQVQNLVDAMAAFSPPAAGQTTLPANYQSSLNTVIAANWH